MNAEAHAPAHVLLFGELAAQTGALALALPLPIHVRARVTLEEGGEVIVRGPEEVRLPLEDLVPMVGTVSYEVARERIARAAKARWPARALGVLPVLARERRGIFDRGARIEIEGTLPLDGGLGVPAACGVAALSALARAYGVSLDDDETARLAHRVQSLFADPEGAPLDTLVPVFGRPGSVLPVVCRPGRRLEPVPIPEGADLLLFEGGGDPARAERSRAAVRASLREGAGILSRHFSGLRYLTEAGVRALDEVDFPQALLPAVAFALRENERAAAFLHETKRFAATRDPAHLRAMGRSLDEADADALACALPAPEAADLVAEVRSLGEARGVLGARTLEGTCGIALVRAPEGAEAATELLRSRPRGSLLCRLS